VGDARSHDEWITGLALAAGAGDRAALTTFIRVTQRDVYLFLTHLCASSEAEYLTRETYLRAMRALPSFVGRCSAITWLLSLARRVAADQIQPPGAPPPTSAEDRDIVVAGSGDHQSGWEEDVLLRVLVAGLDADHRNAFVLTQMLGLGYAAAAEVCGCPISTIRSWVARAREELVRTMNALAWPGRDASGC
jgi:RNA polymerase sigma-70 factor (ECF subfamily)